MWKSFKNLMGLFVYGFTVLIIAVVIAFWWASTELKTPGPLSEQTFFVVESGTGMRAIAGQLQDNAIISNEFLFMAGVRIRDLQSALKAGEYLFEPGVSTTEVINKIAAGAIYRRAVTIPEGLTSHQIVQRLNAFEELPELLTDIPPEGALLPETYSYQRGDNKAAVIEQMRTAMEKAKQALWKERAKNLPITTQAEWLTLASIIEKETSVPAERKRVAGVFINRLRKGMALQTDPTVIYAITMGKHKNDGKGPLGRRLLKKDLEIDSPYNTYKYAGLPPGPIANPGYASLEAALHPEEHDYIYFVADGTGGHQFAKTLAEHNKNVRAWRKVRAAR